MRRSVRTLIPACGFRAIKVLTDLENRRDAFFYRHLGPYGPKERMPLQPEPLRRTPNLPHPGHPDNPGHPASDARDIKVLTDLENRRDAFFYRHSGPYGPKEDMLAIRRAQTIERIIPKILQIIFLFDKK